MYNQHFITTVTLFLLLPISFGITLKSNSQSLTDNELYVLDKGLESRSISFENQTGERGISGKASSHLGKGRKGFPAKNIQSGETVTLCDIQGSGTIRHIWMTGTWKNLNWLEDTTKSQLLRTTVIRAYWDNQEHPSIECPLGDFMGSAHSIVQSYQSVVHSTGLNGALNIWLPMPFTKYAKITLSNESEKSFILYYQIDYTINDNHPKNVGRLHVCFRREDPTTIKKDFEILPKRTGKGRYIGSVLGIWTLEGSWWGEGEIKIYSDGDKEFPTICGTGSEDYVCLSYGMQQTPFLYHGCSLNQQGDEQGKNRLISMYRWHILDPIYWNNECRITIQQIGWSKKKSGTEKSGLYERQDDWCAAAFWYEPIPSKPLPALPTLNERIVNLAE